MERTFTISPATNEGAEPAVTVVSTDGSKANIQGIHAGNYQLGTVQSDVMSYAWDGTRAFEEDGKVDTFRTVAGLYAEAVQLVTMDPEIKSVADLKGKSVSIGAPGSGVYFNAIDVLGAAGLTENDIKAQYQSFADSADALKDGKIDAETWNNKFKAKEKGGKIVGRLATQIEYCNGPHQ